MFDRTDVTGIITTGAFDGNDHPLFEKGADRTIIQITTVIPFGKQRRAEPGKVLIQMTSDLLAAGHMVAGQGSKLIPLAQVLPIIDTTGCMLRLSISWSLMQRESNSGIGSGGYFETVSNADSQP